MATVAPLANSTRWRSRSRSSSAGAALDDMAHTPRSVSHTDDDRDSAMSAWGEALSGGESNETDCDHERAVVALELVVPREYANSARRHRNSNHRQVAPVSLHTSAAALFAVKSIERRRADSFSR